MTAALEGLLKGVGPRLTAAALGATDARDLIGWRNDPQSMPEAVTERLAVLERFVKIFADSGDNASIAAAYLRGSWPELGDGSPLLVIREGTAKDCADLLWVVERVARDGGGF